MKAIEARVKYFEHYVEFEFLVRRLANKKINQYSSKNKSLSTVISAIGATSIINISNNGFSSAILLKQKNVRNWLGHRPKNSIFEGKHLVAAKTIISLNKKIIIAINK